MKESAVPVARAHGQERDLRLFQLYRFLSTSYLFAPIVMVFFGSRGLSVTEITLLNSVYCVTAMLFEVPTGVLADRWGRKRAMVLGSVMMAAGCLLDFAGHSFTVFALGEGLLALGMTLSSGADSAYLYDLLRDAGREAEYRRLEGAATAAKLIGAAAALALGGYIASENVALTYLFTAGICLLASLVAGMLREHKRVTDDDGVPRPVKESPTGRVIREMAQGGRTVLSHRPLVFAVMFSTLLFTLVRMSIYVHQPFLSAAGLGLSRIGVLLALLSLVAAVGAHRIDALRRRFGEHALVLGLPATLAVSYFVIGRWCAPWGISMLLVQSVANGVYSPFSKELLNREIVDSSQRATVLSVESMVRRLAFGLFAPIVGLTIDAHGLSAGLYACGVLGLVGTALLGLYVVRRRATFRTGFEGERTPTPLPVAAATVEPHLVAVAAPVAKR